MKCPKCGFENKVGRRFCSKCGTKLSVKCPKCGFINEPDDKFCGECGARLLEAVSEKVFREVPAVPEEIARKIELVKKELKGSRRNVAVIFADISGFTAMSEKLDPEEVTERMNAVFQQLSDVIYKYEGYIDKFIGDCVMVLFGAPIAHEDDPLRSVLCAIDMMAMMKKFEDLELSIGVNFGKVMAGGVGVDQKMEYTVMGDTVNLAERLQSAAEKGEIYVSNKIQELTKNEIEYRELKPIKVKGKTRPVQIYQPQHIKTRYSLRRIKELPLIGRKEELEKMLSLFENVESGKGEIVSVIGEGGIGKSKMVYEFRQSLPDNIWFLEGKSIEYLKSSPYWTLKEALKDLFLMEDTDSKGEMARKIDRFIDGIRGSEAQNIRDVIPFLKYFFSLELDKDQHNRFESMRPEDRIRMIESAIIYLFQAISKQRPLIILFDDTHWMDKESLNLSYKLAREISKNRIMLLYLYRPECEIEVSRLPYHTPINLKQLTEAEAIDLVRNIFGCKKVSNKLKELLLDKSGSNPFFLQELATTLLNEKLIEIEQNIANLKDGKDVSVPDSLNELIMSRIDRFDEELKLVIEAASVIGKEFSSKILDGLTELGASRLKTDLGIIEKEDLINRITSNIEAILSEEDEYAFKHIITRDVIYDSLLKSKRIEYHRKIGNVIEKIHTNNLDEYLDTLSYHYKLGEDKEKAVEYLEKSGDRKKELYKNEEAIATYQECINLLESLSVIGSGVNDRIAKIYEKIGGIHHLIGKYDSAIESYHQMAEYGKTDPLTLARAIRLKANIAEEQSRYDEAIKLLADAGDILEGKDKGQSIKIEQARVLSLECWILRIRGEMAEGLDKGYKASEILEEVKRLIPSDDKETEKELKEAQAGVFNNIATVYWERGEYEKAIEFYNKSLEISKELGDKRGVGRASGNLGMVYSDRGEYEKAIEFYNIYLNISKELGYKRGVGMTSCNLGNVYYDRGEYEKAIEFYNIDLNISKELDDKHGVGIVSVNLGLVYTKLGKYKKAEELLKESKDILEGIGDKYYLIDTFNALSELSLQEGSKVSEAKNYASKALELSKELSNKSGEATALLNLGKISRDIKGKVSETSDKTQKVKSYFEQSIKIFKELKQKKSLADAYFEYGKALKSINKKKSKEHLDKARKIYKELKLSPPL